MNIELGPGVGLADVAGKPLALVCEIAADDRGRPLLRAFHPYELRAERIRDEKVFRLMRRDAR